MSVQKFDGYRSAVGCFLCLFVNLGIGFTFGIFLPYLVEATHSTLDACSLVLSIANIVAFLVSFAVPSVIKKLGCKGTLYMSVLIGVIYLLLAAFATNIWMLYLHGVFGGLFMAFGTATPISIMVSKWFIKKRASILGMVIGGGAFGSAVMQYIAGFFCSNYSMRTAYLILVAILVIVPLLANTLLIRDPDKLGQKPLGWEENVNVKDSGTEELPGVSLAQAQKSASFWILMFSIVLYGALIASFQVFATTFWRATGMDGGTASSWLSVWSIVGCVATILFGQIANRWGNKAFVTGIFCCYAIGLAFASVFASSHAIPLLLAMVLFGGIGYPLNTSMHSTICTEAFGPKDYSKIVAWLGAALFAGRAVASPLFTTVLNLVGGNYTMLYVIFTVLCVAAFVLVLISLAVSPYRKYLASRS